MSAPDLFGWSEAEETQQRLQALHAARAVAARKVRVAPRGQVQARHGALQAATVEALRAELALARLKAGLR